MAYAWGISPAALRECTVAEYLRMMELLTELAEARHG